MRESHAENRAKWNDFLTLDGTNTVERVRTQIDRITQQNNFLELQLSDISGLIHQFIELNELVKKPEVAVDYRDLDYANQLEFVPIMEEGLSNVKDLLREAHILLIDFNKEFETSMKNKGPRDDDHLDLNLLLEKIKGTDVFKVVR